MQRHIYWIIGKGTELFNLTVPGYVLS